MRCSVNEVANVGNARRQSLEDWPRLLAVKKFSHSRVIDWFAPSSCARSSGVPSVEGPAAVTVRLCCC